MRNAEKARAEGREQTFMVNSQETVGAIVNGKTVIVFLDKGGFKGIAKCGSKDTFDFNVGFQVAYFRAKQLQIQAEIDKLVNPK